MKQIAILAVFILLVGCVPQREVTIRFVSSNPDVIEVTEKDGMIYIEYVGKGFMPYQQLNQEQILRHEESLQLDISDPNDTWMYGQSFKPIASGCPAGFTQEVIDGDTVCVDDSEWEISWELLCDSIRTSDQLRYTPNTSALPDETTGHIEYEMPPEMYIIKP